MLTARRRPPPSIPRRIPSPATREESAELYATLEGLLRVYRLRDRDRACYGRVSANECHALAALQDGDGRSVDELAERLGLHKSNASRLAASLARRGLVRREADASDGRGLRLWATPKGRATLLAIRSGLEARMATVLAAHAPATRRAFIELLQALTAEAADRLRLPFVRSPGARKRLSC